jgi:hypothetical protein
VIHSQSIEGGLVANGSFEHGLWRPVWDAFNVDGRTLNEAGISESLSRDAVVGHGSLRLDAQAHMAGVASRHIGVRHGERLVLHFYWKRVRGTRVAYAPYFGQAATVAPRLMSGAHGWNRHAAVFDVPSNADATVAICLYAGPGSEERRTTALFDGVVLSSIPRWLTDVWFAPVAHDSRAVVASTNENSRLTFTPRTAGPQVVRVTTTYVGDWHASFTAVRSDGSHVRVPAVHVRTVDNLNAWVVRVPATAERVSASFSFGAQRLVNVGSFCSVVALAAVLLFLVTSRFRKRRRGRLEAGVFLSNTR